MTESSLSFKKAHQSDMQDVLDLLTQVKLPTDGVEEHFEHYIVLKDDQKVLGSAGLEVYTEAGLLRSLAVSPGEQGKGYGTKLTQKILSYAKEVGCKEVYLLTTTAPDFFLKKFHFTVITRETVNPVIKESTEFKGACPDTAIVMKRSLS